MAQTTQQPQSTFRFPAGTGVLRSKIGAENTSIMFGRIGLPGYGQCVIDGLAPQGSKALVLDVKAIRGKDRVVVATIEMPAGDQESREGKIVYASGKKRVWKIRGVIRPNASGYHMALRMPDVKIEQSSAFGITKPLSTD